MSLYSIATKLRVLTGLATETVGGSSMETAVKARLQALHLTSLDEYSALVTRDSDELRHLVEQLVVPETWFFRESDAFTELAARAQTALGAVHSKIFRVLSAPCATGEEAYSIAMTLLDLGFPPHRFKIDAVDISKAALATAERGVYRLHSFRGGDASYRARYFSVREGEHRIDDQVRECVRFFEANLADPLFLANELPYQVIFCRNVLIYLHESARSTALASLYRLLSDSGILFAGHAEALDNMSLHFRRTGAGFAYAKRGASLQPPPSERLPASQRRAAPGSERRSSPSDPGPASRHDLRPTPSPPLPKARPSTVPPPVRGRDLEAMARELARASEYAERGELERASVICEKALKEHGPDAGTYMLLGTVRSAQGKREDAETCFGRVLYFDPSHREALLQLALLSEARGDVAGAANFRRRAERGSDASET